MSSGWCPRSIHSFCHSLRLLPIDPERRFVGRGEPRVVGIDAGDDPSWHAAIHVYEGSIDRDALAIRRGIDLAASIGLQAPVAVPTMRPWQYLPTVLSLIRALTSADVGTIKLGSERRALDSSSRRCSVCRQPGRARRPCSRAPIQNGRTRGFATHSAFLMPRDAGCARTRVGLPHGLASMLLTCLRRPGVDGSSFRSRAGSAAVLRRRLRRPRSRPGGTGSLIRLGM